MLKLVRWFERLFGGAPRAPSPVSAQSPTAPSRAPPAPYAKSAPPAAAAAACAPDRASFGVRRPMVDARGGVAGFEFLLPVGKEQQLLARRDPAALGAYYAALLVSAEPTLGAGRAALLRLPAALLARLAATGKVPAGAMVAVSDLSALPTEIARSLRQRRVKLGVPDCPPAEAPSADFVLLQTAEGGLDTLMLSAQRWQEARPRILLVATGLPHVDDVERALAAGVGLAGGHLNRADAGRSPRPLNAAAHRICELMNMLLLGRDTRELADAIRSEVALAYRLLRYASSPGIGTGREVETVEKAVMLLGRNELQRWLTVLLMSAAEGRQASQALQEQALARGRLLELLGTRAGETPPQALFSVGMLSMLEVLMQMPLAAALAPLKLTEPARLALLERSGPWADYLTLADLLDSAASASSGDVGASAGLAELERLAERWGGTEAVEAAAHDAWAWASEVTAPVATTTKPTRAGTPR